MTLAAAASAGACHGVDQQPPEGTRGQGQGARGREGHAQPAALARSTTQGQFNAAYQGLAQKTTRASVGCLRRTPLFSYNGYFSTRKGTAINTTGLDWFVSGGVVPSGVVGGTNAIHALSLANTPGCLAYATFRNPITNTAALPGRRERARPGDRAFHARAGSCHAPRALRRRAGLPPADAAKKKTTNQRLQSLDGASRFARGHSPRCSVTPNVCTARTAALISNTLALAQNYVALVNCVSRTPVKSWQGYFFNRNSHHGIEQPCSMVYRSRRVIPTGDRQHHQRAWSHQLAGVLRPRHVLQPPHRRSSAASRGLKSTNQESKP